MSHQYATVEDMKTFAIPAVVLRDCEVPELNAALVAASSRADSYFENRYPTPIAPTPIDPATIPDVVKETVANLAAFIVIKKKGIRPNSDIAERLRTAGFDVTIREGHDDAIIWLKDVAAGRATLPAQETAVAPQDGPDVLSDMERGWDAGQGIFGGMGQTRDPEDPFSVL